MRYLLKQRLISFGDDFNIKDEAGNDVYFVDGKAISIGDKLSFQDMTGTELAFIKQRILAWGRTYEIMRGGEVIAVVRKQPLALIHHRFTVTVSGAPELEAEGNFLDREYAIRRGDSVVATVSKRWFSLSDSYGIEVDTAEDQVLILACAVVIDESCHPDDEGSH